MAGMFGRNAINPFGATDPYLAPASPADGGLAGNAGLDTSLPADPYAGQRTEPNPGFFGKLGQNLKGIDWGTTLLGGLADGVAKWGGAEPGYSKTMRENSKGQRELTQALLLARAKAQFKNSDSPYVRDAEAIGLTPGTPEFARWITNMRQAPRIITAGNQVIDAGRDDTYGGALGNPQPQAGPPPGAIDMLRQNPALAAQFDQKYGAGASRQYLGQ